MTYYLPLLPCSCNKVVLPISLSNWAKASQSVIGYRHIESGLPCQDACLSKTDIRPVAILCDGAGSAKLSHIGSQTLTSSLFRLCSTLEPLLRYLLDIPRTPEQSEQKLLSNLLARHSKGVIKDLASSHQQLEKDFRTTLLVMIVGQYRSFWLQVGDGFMLSRDKDSHRWTVLTSPDKGEFANQTCFIDANLSHNQVQSGCLNNEFDAVMLLSDGSGEKLVNLANHTVSNAACNSLLKWLDASYKSANKNLHHFLSDPNIWSQSTGDDKSIAMLAYQNSQLPNQPLV